jgi:hypothetical protein
LPQHHAAAYRFLVRQIEMKLFTENGMTILLTFLLLCAANSQPAPDPIVQKICSGSCAGGIASVTPWCNSTGKIGYYEFSGDLRTCSHPPLILYDSKGREALTIPNQPLDSNNKEMVEKFKKLHQKREELLKRPYFL